MSIVSVSEFEEGDIQAQSVIHDADQNNPPIPSLPFIGLSNPQTNPTPSAEVDSQKCIHCNTEVFHDSPKITNISRQSQMPPGTDEVWRNQSENEVVSVVDAVKLIFRGIKGIWSSELVASTLFLCERCGRLLEVVYNAYQDFVRLAKEGSTLLCWVKQTKGISAVNKRSVPNGGRKGRKRRKSFLGRKMGPEIVPRTTSSEVITVEIPEQNNFPVRNDADQPLELSYRCSICELEFLGEEQFREHLTLHDDPQAASCSPEPDGEEDQSDRHEQNDIPEINETDQLVAKVKVPKREGSKGDKVVMTCDVCGKKFGRQDHLKLHLRIHTGEKPYICKLCDKAFSDPRGLAYHEITHSSERPYCCTLCGLTFKRLHHLNDHEKNHSNVPRPFTCPTCGKAFKYKKHLNSHMVIHRGTKEHQCDQCLKCFNRKDNLRQHAKKVHGKKTEGTAEGTSGRMKMSKEITSTLTAAKIVQHTEMKNPSGGPVPLAISIGDPNLETIVYMHL